MKKTEALEILRNQNVSHKIVFYLKEPFSKNKLKHILNKIKLKPSEIVRKNEQEWKSIPHPKKMSENQILDILIAKPKLIERPIVTNKESGVLARPIDNLIEFLKKSL